jgi:hypothetical protein
LYRRALTAILFSVWGAAVSCAPKVSDRPLSTEPSADGYYYGAPTSGGKVLQISQPDPAQARAKPKTKTEDVVAKAAASGADTPADASTEAAAEPAAEPFAQTFAGDYSGKDTVVIELSGFPPQPQEDEHAKLRVTVDGLVVSVTVVDSNSGDDLCTINGEPKGAAIQFKPGQSCFEEMLGIPMTAELEGGEATLADEQLRVRFVVKLELADGGESRSGKLTYLFEGERD